MEQLSSTDRLEGKFKNGGGAPCGLYRPAVEAEELIREVTERYHPHLLGAKMLCLFRGGKWQVRGRTIRGKALVAAQPWRYLCGSDLVLVLNEVLYFGANPEGKIALIDHELSHFNPPGKDRGGEPVWSLRDHDVREFSDVVNRHNICMSNLKAIGGEEQMQLTLDLQSFPETIADHEAVGKVYNQIVEIEEEENYFLEDFEEPLA